MRYFSSTTSTISHYAQSAAAACWSGSRRSPHPTAAQLSATDCPLLATCPAPHSLLPACLPDPSPPSCLLPLRLLRQHLPELGSCAEQSLEQLGLYKSDMAPEMVHLQPNTPTLLAYKQLADAGVTGAPVVSTDGRLIANLSISDIR